MTANRSAKAAQKASVTAAPIPRKRAASSKGAAPPASLVIERVQTGLRIEKRMLKVLKAVAEYHDIGLGDLVEGIVLHAFDGRSAFGAGSLARIADLKRIYGLDLDGASAHRLVEEPPPVERTSR